MNKKHIAIYLFTLLFSFLHVPYALAALEPVAQGAMVGLGKYDRTGITVLGDYKDCGTEAFFYLLTVNETDEETVVTLPWTIFIEPKKYFVSNQSYTYKNLGSAWRPEQFADAKNGGASLDLDGSYKFTLPPHTAYSIMGKAEKIIPQDFRKINHKEEEFHQIYAKVEVSFDDKLMQSEGYIQREGSVCNALNIIPLNGLNYFVGTYGISVPGNQTCSLAYYYEVTNTDMRYSTVVELPQWINLNQSRWNIGCKIVDETCTVSGFRHYAYAPLPYEDAIVPDSEYVFCDKDLSLGDLCYIKDDLWWLTIEPGQTMVIRSMVNDLCSSPQRNTPNPLERDTVEMEILLSDAGGNQFHVLGEIKGREKPQGTVGMLPQMVENDRFGTEWISQEGITDPVRTHEVFVGEELITVDNMVISDGAVSGEDVAVVEKSALTSVSGAAVPVIAPTFLPLRGAVLTPDCGELCGKRMPETGYNSKLRPLATISLPKMKDYTLLQIPSLNVSTEIALVPQSEENNSWAVEWLNVDAGLLEGTALPGEGVSVIAAHNHLNKLELGPFAELSKLRDGDRMFLQGSDGGLLTYRVYENVLLSADLPFSAVYDRSHMDSLVLLTCEDESEDGVYLNRRLIYADPL